MYRFVFFFLLFQLYFDNLSVHAQTVQNTSDSTTHSPTRAAIYSAILPGLGQVYNKKYWKVPVIYAASGVVGYFYVDNNRNYQTYKKAYKYRTDNNPNTIDDYIGIYSDENLKILRDFYRRNLELTIIFGAAVYALNIIDAAVDAHLFDFEVNDNLSIQIQPQHMFSTFEPKKFAGIKIILAF